MTYYVYILRCGDDSLYIGITTDLDRRMKAHCGEIKGGAKYTRSRRAKRIEAAWKAENRSSAAKLEYALKRLNRSQKLTLLSEPELVCEKYTPQLNGEQYCVCGREEMKI